MSPTAPHHRQVDYLPDKGRYGSVTNWPRNARAVGGVQAVVDVRRPAHGVAGDGDRRDDLRRPEEVGAAGVAVAGAAVAGGRVHRDAQPGLVHRVQRAGRDASARRCRGTGGRRDRS